MKHPNQDDLFAFAAGEAPEPAAENIYRHLAECDACGERLHAIGNIRSDFDGSWARFIDEARFAAGGMVEERSAVRAPSALLALRIRCVVDTTRRLATAAMDRSAEEMRTLLQARFAPAYAGVADATSRSGAAEKVRLASEACGRGNNAEARKRLEEASRLDPDAGSRVQLDLLHGGDLVGQVVIDAPSATATVIIHPSRLETASWTAVLAPSTPPDAEKRPLTRRKALEPVEGAPYLLAEFENLSTVDFSITLEGA